MFRLQWFGPRAYGRGRPGLPGGQGRRLVVLGLVAAACLSQTGCQSGPFSPCGFVGRTTSRLMRPFSKCGSGCATGTCGEVVADGGCFPGGVATEAVVAPGISTAPPIVVPPASSTPSNVGSPDTQLDAIPSATPGPAPTSRSSGRVPPPANQKTSSTYETLRPDSSGRVRGESLARNFGSTPAPAPRSAQEVKQAAARGPADVDSDSVLDRLPPLDLPREVTERGITPPVAPAVEREKKAPAPSPATTSTPAAAPAAAAAAAGTAASQDAPAAGEAPGMAHFAVVDMRLAGGSVPTRAGLDWLADRGYKTIVDLREPSEASAGIISQAARRGVRYIALPAASKAIDRDQVSRFNFEIADNDARPLYFFDADGSRAGALWYIRRVALDRVERDVARREAEDIGLKDSEGWLAATNYLDALADPHAAVPATSSNATSAADPPPVTPAARPVASSASASS
ncbi:hypothetical protein OJF2_62290 [Aquisphaera giovannonii]|uniref:DSP-PTPase phosphatase fused to NAD+ Kinase domain-containing protein n=1 Tax=Aquisphaera giovannonii TaxID=406548 RepID=A0A5B9WAG7_9BACT|nr:hypothetical protein [Aquisphaera giovannonii]QEH37638.1 hypothetical protein OJF2_62290 [Aquisphaera giovannonii]